MILSSTYVLHKALEVAVLNSKQYGIKLPLSYIKWYVMIIHKSLSEGRWFTFSLMDQMANVGTDIERALSWKKRGQTEDSEKALARGLELLDFTIADPKNKKRRQELFRIKEALLDYFYGDNQYGYTDAAWQQYFYCYAYASAKRHER